MTFFGLSEHDVQERIDAAINAVNASLRREYTTQRAEEQQARSALEERVAALRAGRETDAAIVAGLQESLAKYERKEATSKTLAAVTQPGTVTFANVLEMAAGASDEGYQHLRNFFMVEAAKKGYENKTRSTGDYGRNGWDVYDSDSALRVSFTHGSVYKVDKIAEDTNLVACSSSGSDPAVHQLTSGRMIDFTNNQQNWKLCEMGKVYVLVDERSNHPTLGVYILGVSTTSDSAWKRQLQDDLPEIFKAFAFGTALSYLDGSNHEAKTNGRAESYQRAALLMRRHGLETCEPLLRRMAEMMKTDAVLGGAIMSYYDTDAAQLRLPLAYRNEEHP